MQLSRRAALAGLAGIGLGPSVPIRAGAETAPSSGRPDGVIAMLLYPGFTALDLVGPYHFLGGTGMHVELVSRDPSLAPVSSDIGLAIEPTASFDTCPENVTALFVPGGTKGTLDAARDSETIAFLRSRAAGARYITSVCTGSLVLGVAGLLQGKRATSHWLTVDALAQFGAIPVSERVVRDGHVVTGAGVAAGLDFGLALAAELTDEVTAEAVHLISEYDPAPPFPGGSPATARPHILEGVTRKFTGFVEEVRTLRIAA